MTLYSIRDWNEHFENATTRQRFKSLLWLALPTKHDGKGFRRLIKLPNGCALFGAFVLIAETAAKCPKRGVLADNGGPLTAEDIADATGAKAEDIAAALQICSDPAYRVNWIIATDDGQSTPHVEAHTMRVDAPTPQVNKTDIQEGEADKPRPPAPDNASAKCDAAMLVGQFCKKAGQIRKPWLATDIAGLVETHGAEAIQQAIDSFVTAGTTLDALAKYLNLAKQERARCEKTERENAAERKKIAELDKENNTPEGKARREAMLAELRKVMGAPRPPKKPL